MAFRVYRAAFEYRGEFGRSMVNVLHFGGDDAILPVDDLNAKKLADKLAAGALVTRWRGLLDASQTFDRVVVTEMLPEDDTGIPEAGEATVSLAGTMAVTGDLPAELCAVVNKHTGIPKRYARGWWFMPPAQTELATAGGNFLSTSTYMVNINALIAELGHWNKGGSAWGETVAWGDATWGLGVYSRTRHNKGLANYFFHCNAYSVATKPHWLRSRAK